MGKPVVSTSVGAEGLALCNGDSILLADDADSFGKQVLRLLTDPHLAQMISHNGRSHVTQNFDWLRIGERLSDLLRARFFLVPREARD
jgi:glycosyltransferase involved in cell wall biosynthesis